MLNDIKVRKVSDPVDMDKVFAIRKTVFVMEQNCPPELEWEHEEESTHFLATINNEPAGAARWRKTENGYKLERFAVLKEQRGKGIAGELVKAVLNDLPKDATYIYLNAQVDAIGLYRKFGFIEEGDLFEEAGISHRRMVKH